MADENTQTPGDQSAKAEKAQHAQDLAEVREQIQSTEFMRVFSDLTTKLPSVPGMLPGPFLGPPILPNYASRTSFEGHDLNAMIDLVENANPAELEQAGAALWEARDALKAAAEELSTHIESVAWKGEGATGFRDYGMGLVKHAEGLGRFADAAAQQITVAGTGLASVHKAMPPRDPRLVDQYKPDEVPFVSRVKGNATYDMAVKVEKDRQEAINQMNRLSSFYAVSQQNLAGQEPPKFDQVLKANVPPPSGGGGVTPRESLGGTAADLGTAGGVAPAVAGSEAGPGAVAGAPGGRSNGLDTVTPVDGGIPAPGAAVGAVAPAPGPDTSMELAQVATPQAPAPTGIAAPPAPTAAPPVLGTNPPPMAPGYAPPVQGGTARVPGIAGGRTGQPPMGRATATGQPPMGRAGTAGGQPPMGRGTAGGQPPMGRTTATGQPPMGRSGTSAGGQPPMGRSTGPMGQTPMGRAGGPMGGQSPMGRAGTTGQTSPSRTGRADGIMGGSPQRTAPGSSGSRIPRGTVVGNESATTGRSTSRPAPGTNGVVGAARSGTTPTTRPGTSGFTQGGAGLVRGGTGQRNANDREEQEGSQRPDYLTEDEETWTAGRRSAVPPVID